MRNAAPSIPACSLQSQNLRWPRGGQAAAALGAAVPCEIHLFLSIQLFPSPLDHALSCRAWRSAASHPTTGSLLVEKFPQGEVEFPASSWQRLKKPALKWQRFRQPLMMKYCIIPSECPCKGAPPGPSWGGSVGARVGVLFCSPCCSAEKDFNPNLWLFMPSLAPCLSGFIFRVWLRSCILQKRGDSKQGLVFPSWGLEKRYTFYFGPKKSHLGKFSSISDLHL